MAAIGGAKLDATQPWRGKAIPSLTGAESTREDDVYAQYRSLRMVRGGGWKLVRHVGNEKGSELYNLERDPAEKVNLLLVPGGDDGPVLRQLDQKLYSFMEAIEDPELGKLRSQSERVLSR